MSILARTLTLAGTLAALGACQTDPPRFQALDPERTGITFSNDLAISDTFNAILYEYIYNGGGVGAGDLNGDGLTDLVFSGNMVSSRLYLNRGDFRFEDVTEAAGLITERWCTGVSLVDINGDGLEDIYFAVAGYQRPEEDMANLLFVNQGPGPQGVPRFEEQARPYGLADTGYSTQAAFVDYDLDGDLDAYMLTNAVEDFNRNRIREKKRDGTGKSTDRLYRNNGDGTFTDVSAEAGILIEGYGLGVSVSDLNQDGWPDIYCANDFLTNDLVWINNRDGTFTNRADRYLKHQTHNGMGMDIADIDNDSRPDIAVLDMLPEGNYRQKLMVPNDNYDKYLLRFDFGYQPQYMRNTLQWHRGYMPDGSPRFSEIGLLAGLAATDWSWSVLLADLDNDGWKDAYITNGYRKDVTNLDYIRYADLHSMFGTEASKRERAFRKMEELPEVKVRNYLYHNQGDLTFSDQTAAWGLAEPSFSNGAAYADLDNDGDLDLVVNNIDAPALVYRNQHRAGGNEPGRHFLRLRLDHGTLPTANTKVWVYAGERVQYLEYLRYRGYKSTVEPYLHVGLGETSRVDSVRVVWPDGQSQRLGPLEADQLIEVPYAPDPQSAPIALRPPSPDPFLEPSPTPNLPYRHAGNSYNDFKTTRTLPHMHSEGGPPLAVGDVDGDGREDLFVGGDVGQPGQIFRQTPDGTFSAWATLPDTACQDMGSLFFDADADGDLDLYVASGGTHLATGDPGYQDRLYLNDGQGRFRRSPDALPAMPTSGGVVRAADYDADGDLDLFVGGRILPGRYPLAPKSYLLRNDGGTFADVTETEAPDLLEPGLVHAGLWTDFDNDGRIDLLVAGEWMPVCFFRNTPEGLRRVDPAVTVDESAGPRPASASTAGWWNSLAGADLDLDGDVDYVLGNLGRNAKLKATQEAPLRLFADDFDRNGALDPLIAITLEGETYALHARDNLIDQIAGMKRRFPDYASYGRATFDRTIAPEEQSRAERFEARLFDSGILENLGAEGFRFHPFPAAAQVAPVFGLTVADLNGDLLPEVLAVGNRYGVEQVLLGRYDASYGHLLLNRGSMDFRAYPTLASGFVVEGEGRALVRLNRAQKGPLFLASRYADSLRIFRHVALATSPILFEPDALDARLWIELDDGREILRELTYGAGYIGQSTRRVELPPFFRSLRVRRFDGSERLLQPGDLGQLRAR